MQKGAVHSDDRKYRYKLWRIWDNTKPLIGFIGLNPSFADGDIDDPTITKLITLSKNWDFGGFYISNLFAYVSTAPNELTKIDDPIGIENNKYLIELVNDCNKTVLIWGNAGTLLNRNKEVLKLLNEENIFCVGLTKYQNPIHPLYKKGNSKLIKFANDNILKQGKNEKFMEGQDNIIESIIIYKINPNEREQNGEVTFDRNVDGRIFSNCLILIVNDTAIIKNKETKSVKGIFSLHHFYFLSA